MIKINKDLVVAFIMLTLGAILAAFSVEEFLSPNNIFDGGIIGVSMIIGDIIDVKLGILVIVINLPFIIYALRNFGKIFLVKAFYAMVVFSVSASFFETMENATYDLLLATVFGGVVLGIGVGLVLRYGGCLDGTEIVAIGFNRKTGMSVGTIILSINIIIYAIVAIRYGLSYGLYSILMYFITAKVIDIVELGFDQAKAMMIITEEGRVIADEIYRVFGRTVTFIKGEGFISNTPKDVLYCVVTRAEIYEMRKVINSLDVNAFITINDVSEIIGTHIKQTSTKS